MKARDKRLALMTLGMGVLTLATVLVFSALGNNLSYFFSPTEVIAGEAPQGHLFRLGGLVKVGTVKRSASDLNVDFIVTDNLENIRVRYSGILPDLFKEGQGVIAQGRINPDGIFIAEEVLAKHDENYMPPEVAAALAKGHQEGVVRMGRHEVAK